MAHVLVLGMTLSGKTMLAKSLAAEYRAAGISVLVLDPLRDPGWHADYQTSDPEEFLNFFWGARSCAVFIDEAADSVGRYDLAMQKTATRGRHWGHRVHYLSQRGTSINRTVRDQCSRLFLFASSLSDCKIHANEWNKPELLTAPTLPSGSYMACSKFGAVTHGKIF